VLAALPSRREVLATSGFAGTFSIIPFRVGVAEQNVVRSFSVDVCRHSRTGGNRHILGYLFT